MHIYVIFLFVIFQLLLLSNEVGKAQFIDAAVAENRAEKVKLIAAATFNYYREKGNYPADVATLKAATGYEYLRDADLQWQGISVATGLNDGVWTYKRVAVYTQDPYNPLSSTDYFSGPNNTCGTGAFSTSQDWCGRKDSLWWKHETRQAAIGDIARERLRQKRLLDKFAAYYNENTSGTVINGVYGNYFPNPGTSASKLTLLVSGYSQTATTCSGVYSWNGIPIDCTDLYSIWGTPTVYNYLGIGHISLLAQSPYTDASGTPVFVSTDISL